MIQHDLNPVEEESDLRGERWTIIHAWMPIIVEILQAHAVIDDKGQKKLKDLIPYH